MKQRKIILSIQYQKKCNYLIHNEKSYINYFIPYKPKKKILSPFIEFNQKKNNNHISKKNNIFIYKINNNNFIPF